MRFDLDVREFLRMEFNWTGTSSVILAQPRKIQKILYQFRADIDQLKEKNTPTLVGHIIVPPKEEEEALTPALQDNYMSGVGMMLYLSRWTRPDLVNASRELSKAMKKATVGHYRSLLRCIKYLDGTPSAGLEMKVNRLAKWVRMVGYVDSDWAGNPHDRKSVSGWILFVAGCVISWGSRAQKSVTLSLTTAEYVALTEVSREILYVHQVTVFMCLGVQLPVVVYCDNTGEIFLSNNQESKRTKYLDVKYHFIREQVENGIIKVMFISGSENLADPFTKGVPRAMFEKHAVYLKSPDT